MSKILELRTKRNTLWEQTKDFLEKNRGENGLVKAEAVEQYNKMAQEVKDLGAEIERLEQQAQIEVQLSAPTSSPVHADPKNGAKKDVKPTATAEYAENFWNMIRNRGHYGEVRHALSVGEDTEGGFTVPDEFEKKLVEALEENNIFRNFDNLLFNCSCFFSHNSLILLSCFFLVSYGFLASLAGAGIVLRALSANGKPQTVTNPTVATDVHQTLDVQLNRRTQLSFDFVTFAGNDVTDGGNILIAPILHLEVVTDLCFLKDRASGTSSNTVDIGQAYLASFIFG